MKTTSIVAVAAAVIVVVAAISVVVIYDNNSDSDDRDTILVTMAWEKELVETISGDEYNVVTICEEGVSPHADTISSDIVAAFDESVVIFLIGSGPDIETSLENAVDDWDEKNIVELVDADGITLVTSSAEETSSVSSCNPHIWMSASNLQAMAECIVEELTKLNADNESVYEANYDAYCDEVEEVNELAEKAAEAIESSGTDQTLVVWHNCFVYAVYDINSILEEEGSSITLTNLTLDNGGTVTADSISDIEANGGIIYAVPFDSVGTEASELEDEGITVNLVDPTASDILASLTTLYNDMIEQYGV